MHSNLTLREKTNPRTLKNVQLSIFNTAGNQLIKRYLCASYKLQLL